ncbi:MAG: hypothetical protein ACOYOI_02410 [Chthoniobacterales bacterium]
MQTPLKHGNLQEEGRTVFVIVSEADESAIPSNAQVVKSFSEAKRDLINGEAYVEFRKYMGVNRTGSIPWVVVINDCGHQVVVSQHPTLLKAFQKATAMNALDSVASDKPEFKTISLFRGLLGINR